jgi:hypothetical protein
MATVRTGRLCAAAYSFALAASRGGAAAAKPVRAASNATESPDVLVSIFPLGEITPQRQEQCHLSQL